MLSAPIVAVSDAVFVSGAAEAVPFPTEGAELAAAAGNTEEVARHAIKLRIANRFLNDIILNSYK